MYAHTTQRIRKPAYFAELEDPTKQIDLTVLEEHLRRSKRTMIIATVAEPELERTTLQFRSQPVYPIKRRRFPVLPLGLVLMIASGVTTWLAITG